jgi:hypothetical protein
MRRNVARRLERAKYNAGNPDGSAGGEIWVLIGRSVECEYRTRNNEYRISKGNAEMRRMWLGGWKGRNIMQEIQTKARGDVEVLTSQRVEPGRNVNSIRP